MSNATVAAAGVGIVIGLLVYPFIEMMGVGVALIPILAFGLARVLLRKI